MLGVSAGKMKTLTVKMKTLALIDKGRQNVTFFVYQAHEINSKILFNRYFIFLGVILHLDKYIFPSRLVLSGGVLESSCNWVHMVVPTRQYATKLSDSLSLD